MNIRCLKCKGRGFCGRVFCAITAKLQAAAKIKDKLPKENFFGSSPAPFVGRYGYPYINVGILAPPEEKETRIYDAPQFWSSQNYNISQIIELRSSLINSRFKSYIKDNSKMLGISQEVGMASKPVDMEISLEKKPIFRVSSDAYAAPTGPNAKLRKVQITSNPKINAKVQKVVDDTGLKPGSALAYLYDSGFDENFLAKLLSVGTLGLKNNRKLVPTRFSITASDDILAKHLLQKVKEHPELDYSAYFGSYLGNYYLILSFPEVWSYELFETYMPKAEWNQTDATHYMTDYEPYDGRKTYAENCAGGYYSVRLAILEHLAKIRRQASVLALRFITGEYAVPLGVWVCRESARKSLSNKPIEFASKELMFKYAKSLIRKKFGYDLEILLKKSIILKNLKNQKKLSAFIK